VSYEEALLLLEKKLAVPTTGGKGEPDSVEEGYKALQGSDYLESRKSSTAFRKSSGRSTFDRWTVGSMRRFEPGVTFYWR